MDLQRGQSSSWMLLLVVYSQRRYDMRASINCQLAIV